MADLPPNHPRSVGKDLSRWFRKSASTVVIVLIVFAFIGATYQFIGNWRDARRFPQQGRSVRAGPMKLNLDCIGTGGPTVILESGGGMSSIGWINIQPEIAKFTRVCSYDRAGYGWSEPGPEPRTALQIALELKLLLDAAAEKGPYVMVGPSLGGLYVRVYAGLYPPDVAGVVLVDATHEDQLDRLDAIFPPGKDHRKKGQEREEKMDEIFTPLKIHLGIQRLEAAFGSEAPPLNLSKEFWEEFQYLDQQTKSRNASASEMKSLPQTNAQARSAGTLGARPLIVLTGGKMEFVPEPLLTKKIEGKIRNLWINVLQVEEAHLSTRGKQIIVQDSGHVIQFERPDAVISAIHEVWSAAAGNHSGQ